MIKAVLWTAFVLTLVLLWCREVLAYGAARRLKADSTADQRKLRRRSLGLFVLFLLGLFYELASIIPFAHPLHELVYYGVFVIVLVWLLIIAARDLNDIAQTYVQERRDAALQALVDLEGQIGTSGDSDDMPIPPIKFPASTQQNTAGDNA
ncbi:MAG: hypothetical protein PWP23_2077 [Candidatus Sumerlaeota bacterium]|nr:hypothetical protein [Candidatus Sumerlaeota bacterium]